MGATELHLFRARPDGRCDLVGRWLPPLATAGLCVYTSDPDQADRWAEGLRAGVPPDLDRAPDERRVPSLNRPLSADLP